jgi:hypothetical protein
MRIRAAQSYPHPLSERQWPMLTDIRIVVACGLFLPFFSLLAVALVLALSIRGLCDWTAACTGISRRVIRAVGNGGFAVLMLGIVYSVGLWLVAMWHHSEQFSF